MKSVQMYDAPNLDRALTPKHVELRKGSKFVHLGPSSKGGEFPKMFFEVDIGTDDVEVRTFVFIRSHTIGIEDDATYLGTVLANWDVFHLYEVTKP